MPRQRRRKAAGRFYDGRGAPRFDARDLPRMEAEAGEPLVYSAFYRRSDPGHLRPPRLAVLRPARVSERRLNDALLYQVERADFARLMDEQDLVVLRDRNGYYHIVSLDDGRFFPATQLRAIAAQDGDGNGYH